MSENPAPVSGTAEAGTRPGRPRFGRDFWLLWFGQGVSSVGSAASDLAYPLLVLHLGGTPFKAGLVGLVSTGSRLLLRLVAGLVVDVCSRKRVLIWCDVGRAATAGGLAAAVVTGTAGYPLILGAAFLEGAFSVFFFSAERAVLPYLVPRTRLSEAIAHNQIYLQAATIAGAPVGGFLFSLGAPVPFLVDTGSYLVSLAAVLGITTRLSGTEHKVPLATSELFQGMRWVWHDRPGRASLLYLCGINAIVAAMPLGVIVGLRTAGVAPAVIGILLACGGIGGAAGALAVPQLRTKYRDGALLIALGWLWPPMLAVLAVSSAPWAVAIVIFLLATTIAPTQSIIFGYQTAHAPDELQGRVHSAVNLLSNAVTPLAPAVVGALVSWGGFPATGAALAVGALTMMACATTSRSIRQFSNR
ncbi:MFS transporter [Streptomyces sp. CRPSP2-6A1]|uniref:MFS transporter n=1 Tax=Streptomyces sp. CRPSP2-6A1 TaxID=2799588 RepID=UPI001F231D77|nr:MFS transporter [Streptomyces sp. CRPSP2-6A1]